RWTHHDDSGFIPYAITTGLDYEAMTEQRKGYENFVYQNGVYDLGTKGDMRRNERNLMWNLESISGRRMESLCFPHKFLALSCPL
ncbi:TPA: hypothetical protein RK133_004376, partial [Escherichia coli]|nr:hypothetical protein [Escherichia coli]HDW1125352.1 hypothetical protein [Escherichia coli]